MPRKKTKYNARENLLRDRQRKQNARTNIMTNCSTDVIPANPDNQVPVKHLPVVEPSTESCRAKDEFPLAGTFCTQNRTDDNLRLKQSEHMSPTLTKQNVSKQQRLQDFIHSTTDTNNNLQAVDDGFSKQLSNTNTPNQDENSDPVHIETAEKSKSVKVDDGFSKQLSNTNTPNQDEHSDPVHIETAEKSVKFVGVHEYSFSGINIDDVHHGEIDIQIIDYASQLLKVQYQCEYGMLPPSYLYSLVTNKQQTPFKIPKQVKAVQMHYITGHYLLSARKHQNIIVLDSMLSENHLREVIPQLTLLYEEFDINKVYYTSPQHQGSTTLCGLFVVANAAFLLSNIDPHKCSLVPSRMRSHFHQCLTNSEVTLFPTTAYTPLLFTYFKDQQNRHRSNKRVGNFDENERVSTPKNSKVQLRKDQEYRQHENDLRTKRRSTESFRNSENAKRNKTRRKKRQDENYVSVENEKRRKKRQDENYVSVENEKRRKKRQDENYVSVENEKRRKKRQDENYVSVENEKRSKTRSNKRKDKNYVSVENDKRSKTRSKKRQDENYVSVENDKRSKTRSKKRQDENYRNKENERKKQKKTQCTNIDVLIDKFHQTTRRGPVNVCLLCKQLWYRHSVCKTQNNFKGKSVKEMITEVSKIYNIASETQLTNGLSESWICNTCLSSLKKNKVPPCSYLNKMTFPDQGPLKNLNVLEQLLIAPVLPFLRLQQANVGKQYRINGNIVLVPSDVKNTVTSLPRLSSDTGTIKAKLKRRLRYKHHAYSMNVRPEKLREGIAFLNKTSKLFREQNILLDENFDEENILFEDKDQSENEDTDVLILESEDRIFNENTSVHESSSNVQNGGNEIADINTIPHLDQQTPQKEIENVQSTALNDDDSETWSEFDVTDEATDNPGIQDTMLSSPDFVEPSEKDFIYNFAPGEGRVPVSVFLEPNSEELSFPSIFCGKARPSKEERLIPVSYSEIVRSELRNKDRRAALSIENLFFKTKKFQMKQLIDQTQIALRKSKTKGQTITAKDVRGNSSKHFIYEDKAFKFMAGIRGSPSYFQAVSKDLFAMIRQLGPATFFCSLSAAETKWTHLLCILSQIVDNVSCTEEEAAEFDWPTKCRLIQSDPVTCARHFDYAVNKLIREFMLDKSNPIGNIQDYFYRVEYQQRGSPHVHMLIWCEETPVYGQDSGEDVIDFIDSYVTCKLPPENDPVLRDLVKLQTHRHSHTCRKKTKKMCRFGFPKPPMDETCILEPLSSADGDKSDYAVHLANWRKILENLNVLYNLDEPHSFNDFLQSLSLQRSDYICAVRTSIKRTTVFLQRETSECRINSYNPHILKAWRANIDLQFVIDVYACASYIAAYVTKSHRGMSELLRNAAAEAQKGNLEIRQQVRAIGNKFLNAVEIGAQEAVYICLGLPMRKSSRQVTFVNTSPPEDRVSLLKPAHELEKLEDDSEEIECSNMLTRYAKRPKDMQNITLANFASNYTLIKKKFIKRKDVPSQLTAEGLLPEQTVSDNEDTLSEPEMDTSNKYRKVKKTRILRYVHFNPDTNEDKFSREQIMLFYPWRDEERDLIAGFQSHKEKYENIKDMLEEERLQYEPYREEVDQAERHLNEDTDMQDIWDSVAPVTEDTDGIPDQSIPSAASAEETYDIGPDLGLPASTCNREEIHKTYELPDIQYRQHMRSLNREQIEFVYDTIHQLKTSDKPVYRFLSGGAGCGKSHLTKALYQMSVKFYNSTQGKDFSTSPVLLMAPTGKAAYHIRGSTVHNAMKIAANQKLEHKPLASSTLNTFRNQLGDIQLIFIDEISMVGFRMFNCIHQRLQELKQSKEVFGGVSIIVVGDLFQLKPVHDSYIFEHPSSSYLPLATNLWHDHFKMCELTQIMRQRECIDFALLLNRLREGHHTARDISSLNRNVVNPRKDNYPRDAPHLFTTNARVDLHNYSALHSAKKPVHEVKAVDRLVGTCTEDLRKKIKDSFLKQKNDQLPNIVKLVEGCVYDLTVNLDTADGLTNGATCTVIKINYNSKTPVGPVWVKFQDENAGQSLRTGAIMRNHDRSWTPLLPVSRQFPAGYKGQAQVQRLQYPLRPSAAKTIHRAQGDTMDTVVVDLTTSRKVDHIHYVALSRVTSTQGLNILNLEPQKISVSNKVKIEMDKLRQNKLKPTLSFLYNVPTKFKIGFLNARSLHRHIEDVRCDFSLVSCDIFCCSETRYTSADTEVNTAIPGFQQYRQDAHVAGNSRPAHGMALYSKIPFSLAPVNVSTYPVELILLEMPMTKLISVYRPPSTAVSVLINALRKVHKEHLQGCNAILIGDFNVDFNKSSSQQLALQKFTLECGYHQHIKEPTTDHQSIIDLIFTNLTDVQTGVLEVYYSDHKAVWIGI